MFSRILIAMITAYRWCLSPVLGNHCRFYPSCSQYAVESIATHGAGRGIWLTVRRLSRCHPWHAGGYDPVPTTGKTCHHTHSHAQVNQ